MATKTNSTKPASDKQLSYLQDLCAKAQLDYREPKDAQQASRAIRSVLKRLNGAAATKGGAEDAEAPIVDKPTRRQLAKLRELADNVGESFETPATKREASKAISVLIERQASPQMRLPAVEEIRGLDDAPSFVPTIAEAMLGTSDFHDFEVDGYGAEAAWAA
jgi:hypothetical protein